MTDRTKTICPPIFDLRGIKSYGPDLNLLRQMDRQTHVTLFKVDISLLYLAHERQTKCSYIPFCNFESRTKPLKIRGKKFAMEKSNYISNYKKEISIRGDACFIVHYKSNLHNGIQNIAQYQSNRTQYKTFLKGLYNHFIFFSSQPMIWPQMITDWQELTNAR